MKPEIFASLIERALPEELGLVVEVTNPARFQISMDDWLRTSEYKGQFSVCIPSTPETAFIVKRTVELDQDFSQ